MKNKTPGELLAEKLKGGNVTDEQLKKSTEDFFKNKGVNCEVTVTIGNKKQ
jgi:hypothetical protein